MNAFRIAFFSFILFALEFVLLHVLQYAGTYLQSILAITYALLGIGLGALAGAWLKWEERTLFAVCMAGCWSFLLLSLLNIICLPAGGYANFIMAGFFFFPGLYLARAFAEGDSHRAYWFDMLGAAGAVLFLNIAYARTSSENILLLAFIALSAAGLRNALRGPRRQWVWAALFTVLLAASAFTWRYHDKTGSLDLYHLMRQTDSSVTGKSFRDDKMVMARSYDNLVARVEAVQPLRYFPGYLTSFNGYINDYFSAAPEDYLTDPRVAHGLVEKPRMLVLGVSAAGIIKVAKALTDADRIKGIEINPSIMQMMTRDFVDKSGCAYCGLDIKQGNALHELQRDRAQYDIITLMNLHSAVRVGVASPPDFMHTDRSYGMMLDRLSDDGYLMFEERPKGNSGRYGVCRIIHTLYRALQEKGAKDPERHFFIYTFQSTFKNARRVDLTEDAFVMVLAKKTPLTESDKAKLIAWAKQTRTPCTVVYLYGHTVDTPSGKLMASIAAGRLAADYPGSDLSILTVDKPFPSQSDRSYARINELLIHTAWPLLILLILIAWHSTRTAADRRLNAALLLYQGSIGLAYMMAEILFMGMYQQEFLSPSVAFVATLAPLLMASACGGQWLKGVRNPWAIVTFLCMSFAMHWLFMFPANGLFSVWRPAMAVGLVVISGLLMGYFLPEGLRRAKEGGLGANVGHHFALNCLSGAFAVVFAWYMPMRCGFGLTLLTAAALYTAAAAIAWRASRCSRS